jgi:hypothetical protein
VNELDSNLEPIAKIMPIPSSKKNTTKLDPFPKLNN